MVSIDRWLVDQDGLESPLQGGVLLDVLAVLVEGGGADAVKFAAGEHGLEHVAGVHGAVTATGTDHGMEFVDEQDDLPVGGGDLLHHRLEAFLELAAVLGAGDESAHVEGEDGLVAQALRHVAAKDPLGQPFDDRGLADAGFADEDRVVLRLARQDLDDAADLLVSADHGLELSFARSCDEVAAVLLEGLVGRLGGGAGDALGSAHVHQCRHDSVGGDAGVGE